MTSRKRPLSPHLQIYRPQITSLLSITHRGTGMALVAGALVFAYWLTAAAYGPGPFAAAQAFIGSILGRIVLFGFTFSLYYHLANGLRHLTWDTGRGFEMARLRTTGWIVVAISLVLTVATWGYALRGSL